MRPSADLHWVAQTFVDVQPVNAARFRREQSAPLLAALEAWLRDERSRMSRAGAWIVAADFAATAGGGPSDELSDLAQDNGCARDSGRGLVEEFVDIVGWFEVRIPDIQEADERRQKWLQAFIFGKGAPPLDRKGFLTMSVQS